MKDPLLLLAVILFVIFLIWKLFRRGERWGEEIYTPPEGADETLKNLLEKAKETSKDKEIAKKIEEILENLEDPLKKANYLCALAEFYRGPLKNKGKARSLFIKALEEYPLCKDAYRGLERLLKGGKGAKRLERIYWLFLSQVSFEEYKQADILWLWEKLAELYSTKLNKPKRAKAILSLINYVKDRDKIEEQS